jgi:hypothetical protein
MTAEEAILLAMQSLREAHIDEVVNWIERYQIGTWQDIGTTMADLCYPPSQSSGYPEERCFLIRKSKGLYSLRAGW